MDYYIKGSVSGLTMEKAELEAAANFPAVYRHVGNDKWHVSYLQTTPVQPGQRPFMMTIGERLRLETPFVATYKNYRGEVAERRIQPIRVDFDATDWHPEPQWLLIAYDLDKQAERTFALKDFNPIQTYEEEKAADIATPVKGLIERLRNGVSSRIERNECNDGEYRIDDISGATATMKEAADFIEKMTFPQDYEGIGKRLLEIGAMCDDQDIARTAYDAATALASPVPAPSTDAEPTKAAPAVALTRLAIRTGGSGANVYAFTEADDDGDYVFYTEAEAALSAQMQDDPGDGRPCTMDEFVAALFEDCDDHYGRDDAIRHWLYGDWYRATSYLKPEALARIMAKGRS